MANPVIFQDYLYVDFTQTVSYYQRTADGAWNNPASVPYCLIDNQVKVALVNEYDLSYRTSYWTMWTDNLGGITPQKGDKFVDANSNTWIVENVNDQDLQKCQKYCLFAYIQGLA